ncbi:OmpA family protein [Sphingobium lignivorans]|uniref:OOP family OmpA-OmpF porin n=1 Tax=Sphingobium lignivorans TaxID=2735886 RepID=A0ABR6NAB9_9SPHN|nr:OmpA family protein [Sphingobium lignivorans]MBB5984222.1 OOP family OmpA-OmpF porin [Sphingobium lignivorans]
MKAGLKIMLGAGATGLLALLVHGPLGQGEAFLAHLGQRAESALAAHGLGDIHVRYPQRPLVRTAVLSGDADLVRQSDALQVVRALPGGGGAIWSESGVARSTQPAPAIPVASAAAATPAAKSDTASAKPPLTPPTGGAAIAFAGPDGCQRGVDAAVANRPLSFRSGSAWLNPTTRAIVADVAAALKECSGYRLEVGGHSDGRGSEAVNRALSQERADRVRALLVEHGAPAELLSARGFGASHPLANGGPSSRRITFTVSRETS